MDPADQRQGGIQDERQPDALPPAPVEQQVPAVRSLTLSTFDGQQTELREPGLDLPRAVRLGGLFLQRPARAADAGSRFARWSPDSISIVRLAAIVVLRRSSRRRSTVPPLGTERRPP